MNPALPDLTAWQAAAARRYARDFERSKRDHHCRIEAMDNLRLARAALSPQQVAMMDMVAGRGRSIDDVAAATGRKAGQLATLFVTATSLLSRHYEAGGELAA